MSHKNKLTNFVNDCYLYDSDEKLLGEVESVESEIDSQEVKYWDGTIVKSWDYIVSYTITLTDGKKYYPDSCSIKLLTDKNGNQETQIHMVATGGSQYSVGQPFNVKKYQQQEDATAQYELQDAIPALEHVLDCPEKDCDLSFHKESPLFDVIIMLNDTHGWTREQIADWVETLDLDIYFKSGEENGNED